MGRMKRPIPYHLRSGSKKRLDPIAPGAVLAGSPGPCGFLGGNRHGRGILAQLAEMGPVLRPSEQAPPAPFRLAQLPPTQLVAAENPCGTPGTLGDGEGAMGSTG